MNRDEMIAVILQTISDQVYQIPKYREKEWHIAIGNALKEIGFTDKPKGSTEK